MTEIIEDFFFAKIIRSDVNSNANIFLYYIFDNI